MASPAKTASKKGSSPKASSASKVRTKTKGYPEITIGVIGFFLSIALHETLHLILHWHQITGIRFFPNPYTIAEFIVNLPVGYDISSEEFIAYTISASTLIFTAIIIAKVHDYGDKRTANQILFPEHYRLHTTVSKKR